MPRLVLGSLVCLLVVLGAGCKNRSNRPGDTLTCTPGETLLIGCTSSVGNRCQGDPVIDVCDGTIPPANCTSTNALASNDDSDGLCPQVNTVCPTSGRVTAQIHGYSSSSYQCYWDIVHGGGTPPRDAGATPPDGG